MAIPEGYRLLTAEDIGKVFGVDLESVVYFDTSVMPIGAASRGAVNLTNFSQQTNEMGAVEVCYISTNGILDAYKTTVFEFGTWKNESIEMNNNISVTSYHTDVEWNNWLYVKDAADPYSIKIKNKEGIKLLTKDKTIEFSDNVKVTIDESLLGGGEAKKFNFTLYHESDMGGNSDPEVYSVDGGAFISTPSPYSSVELTGNYLVLYGLYGTGKSLISNVSVTGGTFVGAGRYASSGQYTVIFVTITEDNAEIYYDTYD